MGNRGTVIFTDGKTQHSPAIYLHWNGGPESVYAFLEELDRRGVRADQEYEAARFTQIVGQFFDQDGQGGLSLGIVNGPEALTVEALDQVATDHGDNGFYLVNRLQNGLPLMRRFIKRYNEHDRTFSLTELTADQVESEQRDASRSEYRPAIRALFRKLSGQKAKSPRVKKEAK